MPYFDRVINSLDSNFEAPISQALYILTYNEYNVVVDVRGLFRWRIVSYEHVVNY